MEIKKGDGGGTQGAFVSMHGIVKALNGKVGSEVLYRELNGRALRVLEFRSESCPYPMQFLQSGKHLTPGLKD